MKIAFCYDRVLPSRGGCETYIADLARRLAAEGHELHLFACHWDEKALPRRMTFHPLQVPRGPRFLRPWLFGSVCHKAIQQHPDLVSMGFDKTWGQDVLYPLGGLHVASIRHNLRSYRQPFTRSLIRLAKFFDPSFWTFSWLEKRQYLGKHQPFIVVNSEMVRGHFEHYYGVPKESMRVVHLAIDPERFIETDRLARRSAMRERWGIQPDEVVAAFVAMNYRLKGLEPLLASLRHVPRSEPFRLLVAGNPNTAAFQHMAQKLGVADRVVFMGYSSDPRDCYFAADFLVHPSFYDPCSLVVLEAMACGLPVITTSYNGASELVNTSGNDPREGFVIANPHDDVALAECITRLLVRETRKSMADAARRKASRCTFDAHYQQITAVFAEAAARKGLAA